MLLLGHIGIAAGVIRVGDLLGSRGSYNPDSSLGSSLAVAKPLLPFHRQIGGIRSWLGFIDYRLVLIGSLLPDLVDKPLWLITAGDVFPSGRAYGHTLIFTIVLFILGLFVARYKKSWLLVISLGSICHLILDQMWVNPVVFWWPLLGPLQREGAVGWVSSLIQALFSNPHIYISELVGLVIILLMSYRVIARKRSLVFIRTGVID